MQVRVKASNSYAGESAVLLVLLVLASAGPQFMQAAFLVLFAGVSFLSLGGPTTEHFNGIQILFALSVCWLMGYIVSPYEMSTFYALGELKLLTLFFVPGFFRFLSAELGNDRADPADRLLAFLKVYMVALLIFTGIATVLGRPRDTLLFGHSINAAYGVSYLCAYLGDKVPLRWRLFGLIPMALLGSVTALALYLFSTFAMKSKYAVLSLILMCVGLAAALAYAYYFRGKDLVDGNWQELDRIQILAYYYRLIEYNFELHNYFIGFGLGHELTKVAIPERAIVISGWFLPSFAKDGVYSFGTHNEYLRIFLDYGIIGGTYLFLKLYQFLPKRVMLIVILAGLTNTTVFSSNNIFILSLIVAGARRHLNQAHRESPLRLQQAP